MPAHRGYRFGEYTLDVRRGALLKAGEEVRLRPKSFALLTVLLERHGELVTKDELLSQVWGRAVVTDGAITQCLIDVRRALGDGGQDLIRTVPRRGYIFSGPVLELDAATGGVDPNAGAVDVRRADAEAPAPSRHAASAPRSRVWIGKAAALAAALALVAAALSWWTPEQPDRRAAAGAPARLQAPDSRKAIAVLPFANITADGSGEYFADGIAEEILHLLVQSDGLRVIARTSSFAFKKQPADIDEIASRLDVDYVVEGSVRRSGRRLRVTAQLIDASDSSHVWSRVYDRDASDLLEVQRDIAERIATALEASLAGRASPTDGSVDPRAHEAFLRARFLFHRRLPGDLQKAATAYQEALQLEPRFARAWAGLAGVYSAQVGEPGTDTSALLRQRHEAIARAIECDPGLAEARVRAAFHFYETGDVERSAKEAALARELAPDDPAVLTWLSFDRAARGQWDEAIAAERRVVAADPLSRVVRTNFANTLLAAGRLNEARTQFELSVQIDPETEAEVAFDLARILLLEGRAAETLVRAERWPAGHDRDFALALAYRGVQRPADADAAIGRLREDPSPGAAVRLAELHAHSGDREQAFRWLEEAYDRVGPRAWFTTNWPWLYHLRFSPFLRSLHSDPRWQPLIRRGDPAQDLGEPPR